MRRDDDKNFQRANRLQHIATRALRNSNRHQPLSRAADHHFRRYLKLLLLTTAAWQKVEINPIQKYAREEA